MQISSFFIVLSTFLEYPNLVIARGGFSGHGIAAGAIVGNSITNEQQDSANEADREANIQRTNPGAPAMSSPKTPTSQLLIIGAVLRSRSQDAAMYIQFYKWLESAPDSVKTRVQLNWSNQVSIANSGTQGYAYACINIPGAASSINKFVANTHLTSIRQYSTQNCPQDSAAPATVTNCSNSAKGKSTVATCATQSTGAASVDGHPANAVKTMSIAILNQI